MPQSPDHNVNCKLYQVLSSISPRVVTAGWSIYDKIKLKRDPNMTMQDAPFLTLGTSSCS